MNLYDWMMRSWRGVLMTSILASIFAAILLAMTKRVVNWIATTVPSHYRTWSRNRTQQRINLLKDIKGDVYKLILHICYEAGIALTSAASAFIAIFPVTLFLKRSGNPSDWFGKVDMPELLFRRIVILVLCYLFVSTAMLGFELIRLYRDLRHCDQTIARLEEHLSHLGR
jgi:hypothetical protein